MNPQFADKPLIWVVWRDHWVSTGWQNPKEVEADAKEPDLNDSVGWVLFENDERLTLIQTASRSGFVRNTLTIEKSCIEGRRVL